MYYELVILENFIMDFITLKTADKLNYNDTKLVNLLLASLTGGLYALFSINYSFLKHWIIKIIFSFLMCYIAYPNVRKALKFIVSFYISNFILAGSMLMLKNFSIPIYCVIIASLFIAILIIEWLKNREIYTEQYCILEINHKGIDYKLNCFFDTGNRLVDLKGNAVIIAENSIFENVDTELTFECETVNANSILRGFMPDNEKLIVSNKEYFIKAAIALCDIGNSNYNAILPYKLQKDLII